MTRHQRRSESQLLDRRQVLVPLAAALAFALPAGHAHSQSGDDLSKFRWQRRLLLVFAPVTQDPRLAAQRLRVTEEVAGFRDRDLTVIEVVERGVRVDGSQDRAFDAFSLRSRFDVEDDAFATVLIGKDGGEKLRREGLMPTGLLFETIDAMPMRRQEMKAD